MPRSIADLKAIRLERRLAAMGADGQQPRDFHARHGFDPNQPRVPAGNSDGGQWTTENAGGQNETQIVSDVTPDNHWKPGAQYAQARGRNSGPIRTELGQAGRLAAAQARAYDAIARVRELDPNWRPRPSAYESVEGLIRTYEAEAREAELRIAELGRVGIGPGPFAGESIPARGPGRDFNAWERREGNRIFSQTGCHTCGTFHPGTPLGNCVLDHQMPTAWNPFGRSQRLYPQCLACSSRQGNWISRNRGLR